MSVPREMHGLQLTVGRSVLLGDLVDLLPGRANGEGGGLWPPWSMSILSSSVLVKSMKGNGGGGAAATATLQGRRPDGIRPGARECGDAWPPVQT